jgi:diaminohydroxyphosphoribosylaminopyrimidine deaminase / 5-amino-6-(5-phosphoribosylamino)uracil reductase
VAQVEPPDHRFLRRALGLAAKGRFRTSPNPMVGAVVVRGGEVVGSGFHRRVGGPHAEVEALEAAGEAARGATLYVTLEPCAHHGRTPPCVDAVLASGVARVVACHRDPDPRVAGEGFARLHSHGVGVAWGLLVEEAVALNWRYLTATTQSRPAVTLKWAMSLDGRIATDSGESQWISSARGRHWALELREEHDAVLVGIGTALADDPSLDRRLGKATGPATRVVLDRRLRLPATARLLAVEGPLLVYTEADARAGAELGARGARVVALPEVTPEAVLTDLYGRGIRSLLVEGGAGVLGAFAEAGLFDRVSALFAPLLIGGAGAPGPVGGRGAPSLAAARRLDDLRVRRRGADVVLEGFRSGCLPALCASVER